MSELCTELERVGRSDNLAGATVLLEQLKQSSEQGLQALETARDAVSTSRPRGA